METILIPQSKLAFTYNPGALITLIFSWIKARMKRKAFTSHSNQKSRDPQRAISAGEILAKIYGQPLDTRCLNLSIDGKTVIIDGIVESENEKSYIGLFVAAIPGVQNVSNFMQTMSASYRKPIYSHTVN